MPTTSQSYLLKTWSILVALIMLGSVACSQSQLSGSEFPQTEVAVNVTGNYFHVAWLDSDSLLVAYQESGKFSIGGHRLRLYDFVNKEWQTLEVTKPSGCFSGGPGFPVRLPNNRFGFTYRCVLSSGEAKGQVYISKESSNEFTKWFEIDAPSSPGTVTFSPDLSSAFIQDGEELLQIIPGKSPKQVAADIEEVRSPVWSPDGSEVIFSGFDNDNSSLLNPDGRSIFSMKPDGSDIRVVFSNIRYLSWLSWSPGGRYISFQGRYQETDGIWIYDTQSQNIHRIWDEMEFYDWSPDGKQMVIIKTTATNETGTTLESHPIIIDLPAELQDPPQ